MNPLPPGNDGDNEKRSHRDMLRYTDGDYLRFRQLLLDRCGLFFPENRRSELEYRLGTAFAASTCTSLDEFYALLQDTRAGAVEMDVLINAVTISRSHFFRDDAQTDALYFHVLPRLIERKRAQRKLRIWSAGCAGGEEPYSIVMLLRDLLPDFDHWAITILGTDINTASLNRARNAIYGSWAFRGERALRMQSRYFRKNGNRYELSPAVREPVTFKQLNLVESGYPSLETDTIAMDMVLCRNVTIHFSEAVTRWVVDRFFDVLAEGGWLVVGNSEPCIDIYRRFQVRDYPGTVLYQRMAEKDAPRPNPFTFRASSPPVFSIPPLPVAVPKPTPNLDAGKILQCDPDDFLLESPDACRENPLDQAKELMEYGRSEEALAILLNWIRERPCDPMACSLLGQVNANLGNWGEASVWCQRAIELDKLAIDAYYTQALVFQHQSRPDQAIEAMKKVVFIDQNNILGHYGLANLYRESRLPVQARKSLENTQRLLAGRPENEIIPASNGITAGRLLEAIRDRQKKAGLI